MAYSYRDFLLVLGLLLFATTTPKAHGLLYNGQNVAAIVAKGILGCTSTGNPTPGCLPLASVPVTLSCIGSSLPVFHTTTLSDGSFSFIIADLTAVAALPLATVLAELTASVNLNAVTNCAALPSKVISGLQSIKILHLPSKNRPQELHLLSLFQGLLIQPPDT